MRACKPKTGYIHDIGETLSNDAMILTGITACGVCLETEWFSVDNSSGLVPNEKPYFPNFPEECKNNDNVLCRVYNTSTLINITDLISVSISWDVGVSVVCETNCTMYEFKVECCDFPCVEIPITTEPPSSMITVHFYLFCHF